MFLRLGLIIVIALSISACATGPKSRAMEILSAAGIEGKIHDVAQHRYEKVYRIKSDSSGTKAIVGAGIMEGAFNPIPRSLGPAAFMSILDSYLEGRKPYNFNQVIWWVPKSEMPDDRTERLNFVLSTIDSAALKALPYDFSSSLFLEQTQKYHVSKDYRVTIPEQAENTVIALSSSVEGYLDAEEENAPKFLGNYPAVTFNGKLRIKMAFHFKDKVMPDTSPVDLIQYYRRVSEHLPENAYLYIAAAQYVTAYPLVFDHGNMYLFVKPDSP